MKRILLVFILFGVIQTYAAKDFLSRLARLDRFVNKIDENSYEVYYKYTGAAILATYYPDGRVVKLTEENQEEELRKFAKNNRDALEEMIKSGEYPKQIEEMRRMLNVIYKKYPRQDLDRY